MAVLMLAGGVIGFVKAQSRPSLISGVVSAILLGACAFMYTSNQQAALIAGAVIFAMLEAVFAIRLAKTRKFMPSGMMLIMTGIAEVVTILALLKVFNVL
ncbi:MAG: TMEM14 family protein [Cyanobacteria bacterium]|nr:TMEM14 family protein [Cyanobacteriota bacterium]